MKIKTQLDVITNSSSEVFILRNRVKTPFSATKFYYSEFLKWKAGEEVKDSYFFDCLTSTKLFLDVTDNDEISMMRQKLTKALMEDADYHSLTRRFSCEFAEYHKLLKKYNKFRKANNQRLPNNEETVKEFLERYKDEDLIGAWISSEPRAISKLDNKYVTFAGERERDEHWDERNKLIDIAVYHEMY